MLLVETNNDFNGRTIRPEPTTHGAHTLSECDLIQNMAPFINFYRLFTENKQHKILPFFIFFILWNNRRMNKTSKHVINSWSVGGARQFIKYILSGIMQNSKAIVIIVKVCFFVCERERERKRERERETTRVTDRQSEIMKRNTCFAN